MISYPSCAYDGETVEGPTQVDNFTQGTVNVEALVDGDGDEEVEVLDDESGDDEDELIPPRILDLLFGDDDEEENEPDMLGVLDDDGINIPPTQKQINIATDTSFNETQLMSYLFQQSGSQCWETYSTSWTGPNSRCIMSINLSFSDVSELQYS